MPVILHRLLKGPRPLFRHLSALQITDHSLYPRPVSTSATENPQITTLPLQTRFETWTQNLKPGFTPADVDAAIRAQFDPDLALHIFRWTAQQDNYKHNSVTYLTAIKALVAGGRYHQAETLIEEVIAGACDMSVPLCNSIIRFCYNRMYAYESAFTLYRKMLHSDDCKPTLETYTMLFNYYHRKFNKFDVPHMLKPINKLTKEMKATGVIPDTFVLNIIIKTHANCLEVDQAIAILREMGLYGCEPNGYSYGYIVKGLFADGRVEQGLGFYKEMREKGLVLSGSTYTVVICSLAMERRFEDAIELVFDMLKNSMSPHLLTYKKVLEGMCREGRGNEAFELLEEWKGKDRLMGDKNYKVLLNGLYFVN
ncbi:hypothetical protein Tsubulata_050798 [Turnera subulata]|uniref:Pentacotripeptide-repeat region of PRORP domain-containing protein n=1 Tax=Turnera subulata TaxID=218843 RepID=A0A9Q0GFM1_9ROSI|nr:hypothetical protein Tsubulata_050798 [Turnera subulata]